jgi:hypothetical protein
MKQTLFFFLILTLLTSVTSYLSGQNTPVITIDIPGNIRNTGEVKLSEIAKDIEFIQLETTKECLINYEKSECYIAGKYILVVSRKPVGVMLFDRKGKFIRRIGQVGKGPNEYAFIDTRCIDPSGNFIYLIDPMANKFYKYSISGEVLLSKSYNEYARFWDLGKQKLVFIDKTHLALTPMGKGKSATNSCHVLVMDTNLAITDSLMKSKKDEKIFGSGMAAEEQLAATKDGVMLWKTYLGSVDYLYPDGKVLHKYQINLGGKKSVEENLKNPDEMEQPPYYLTMVRDLPDYLAIFGFGSKPEFVSMVYNKKTGKTFSLEYAFNCPGFDDRKLQVFNDDLVGLPFIPLMEVNYFENIMYNWYNLEENIDNQLNCIKAMNVLLPARRDEILKLIKARTEYANPMIIVMTMK